MFQNRYKSILCQEDTYLLELVRYIHLNPVCAKIVKSLKDSDKYRYSGHSALMGKIQRKFQDTKYVLRRFGGKVPAARKAYRAYVDKKLGVSQPSVSISVKRGEKIAKTRQLELVED